MADLGPEEVLPRGCLGSGSLEGWLCKGSADLSAGGPQCCNKGQEGQSGDRAGTEQFAGSSANNTELGIYSPLLTAPVPQMSAMEGKTRRENLSCTDPICVEKSSDFGPGMGATPHTSPCFSAAWLNPPGDCEFILLQAPSCLFCSGEFSFIRGLLLVLFVCF